VPYDLATIRLKPAWRGTLVRFSLGLEDVGDLQRDLDAALRSVHWES
jgi:cystathionine beta-lyase